MTRNTSSISESTHNTDTDLLLHYAANGHLPTQSQALARWIAVILYSVDKTLTEQQLYQSLSQGVEQGVGLKVEANEFEEALKTAVRSSWIHSPQKKHYSISSNARASFDNEKEEAQALTQLVKNQWFIELAEKGYDFDGVTAEVWSLLLQYMSQVHRQYAYQIKSNTGSWTQAFEPGKLVANVVPHNHPIKTILEKELPAFFDAPDTLRLRFIGRAASKALLAFRLTASEQVTLRAREKLRGQVIILDTNTLICLLNLSDQKSKSELVQRVVQLARELGFRVVITEQTVKEFKSALHSVRTKKVSTTKARRKKGGSAYAPRNLRGVYYSHYAKRFTPQEFYSFYSNIEEHTKDYGVQVDNTLSSEIAKVPPSEDIRNILAQEKDGSILEHDLIHLSFIHSRRRAHATVANAKYWFLSLNKILYYVSKKLGRDLPLALSPSDWILKFRPLIKRVDNFDEFFGSLVSAEVLSCISLERETIEKLSEVIEANAGENADYLIDTIVSTSTPQEIKAFIQNKNLHTPKAITQFVKDKDQKAEEAVKHYVQEHWKTHQEEWEQKHEEERVVFQKEKDLLRKESLEQKSLLDDTIKNQDATKKELAKLQYELDLKNWRSHLEGFEKQLNDIEKLIPLKRIGVIITGLPATVALFIAFYMGRILYKASAEQPDIESFINSVIGNAANAIGFFGPLLTAIGFFYWLRRPMKDLEELSQRKGQLREKLETHKSNQPKNNIVF